MLLMMMYLCFLAHARQKKKKIKKREFQKQKAIQNNADRDMGATAERI